MDQASGTGVAASSSSSAHHHAVAQDEQILSAFSSLRLHPSQADQQRGPASALDTSSLRPRGPGRTSPSTIPLLAAGRGRGRTLPAWMTSGEHAVPGGLRQQQVPRDSGARAGPTGLSSSSTQHVGPGVDTSFQLGAPKKGKSKGKKKKKQQQSAKTSTGTTGGADVHGSATCPYGPAPASEPSAGMRMARPTAAAASPHVDPRWNVGCGLGKIPAAVPKGGLQEKAPLERNSTAKPQKSRPTGLYSSRPQQSAQNKKYTYTRHENQAAGGGTIGFSNAGPPIAAPRATVASNHAPRAGVSLASGGRGRERTLPAWMAPGAPAAMPGGLQHPSPVAPGGLQQQLPHGGGAWAQVPRATASNFHRAATLKVDHGDKRSQNTNNAAIKNSTQPHRQQQSTTGGRVSETATLERSFQPPHVERALRGKPAAAPRPTRTPNRATGGEGSATGRAVYRQESAAVVGPGRGNIAWKPKRSRDEEEPAEGLPSGAPTIPSSAFGQHTTSRFAEPMSVSGRTGGHGSAPRSKKNKATLSDESKPSQKLVATRSRFKIVHHHTIPQPGQIVVATRGQSAHPGPSAGDGRRATSASTSTYTNTRIESYSSGTSRGGVPLPPKPSSAAPINKAPVGAAFSVVIDGSEAALSHRETKGAWSAMGPLLAIQFFEKRGVNCVAFIPRQRFDSITPQSACFLTFLRARESGTIASVPTGANSRLFILKHALDKNAFVVTNDRLQDLAGSSETLAALGQTEAELRAYLSRHQVGYTVARGEFVPDPETPLIRMLTQEEASAKRAGTEASRTTAGAASSSGLPSSPLPRPPPGLSGSRDNPTPSMLQHSTR